MYAEVILPLPLEGTFSYHIPEELESAVRPGFRVLVPFGAKRYYTAVVDAVTPVAPEGGMKVKDIALCLDSRPVVRHPQIKFWKWIASYYLCTVGEVFKAALPAGLKVESETAVSLNPDLEPEDLDGITDTELAIVSLLRAENRITVKDMGKKLGIDKIEAMVSALMEKGIAVISEKIVERYRAVKKSYVRVTIPRGDAAAMDKAFADVHRSPKQESALLTVIALSEFNQITRPVKEVSLEAVAEKCGATRQHINALAAKGLVEIYTREISRFTYSGPAGGTLPVLSQAQEKALREIHNSFFEHQITLLHGVTASGKTEIYIHLIDYVLSLGKQALLLVPEIALTTQLTTRLQKVFGEKVVIYHSKFSDNERVEIWNRLLHSSDPVVVIGARSSVFLPFSSLGLVIVDEEHEASYKQYDPAPRYNARDAATVLASMHGAKTVFGSATPAVETYYKATTGKFGLVSLTERFENATLPDIEIVNLAIERKKGALTGNGLFSNRLTAATRSAIADGKQAILFHNRRGYAPMARCKLCQFTPKCDHCDVSLTYHRYPESLECHYCGAQYPVPKLCPNCNEPAIEIVGFGTERLEEEVEKTFAGSRILRMDLDTTRNKDGHSRIIDEFSRHQADILVGTQMVTKGLDFGDVRVVGVLNADAIINYPDFRSAERAFNMLEQVAGRAGRRDAAGKVVIQTYNPEHPVIRFVQGHDYAAFYAHELEERRAFNYPPFSRIINVFVKHRDRNMADSGAQQYAAALRQVFGPRVTGPIEPPVSRVQSLYIRKIMLKVETNAALSKVKEILRQTYIGVMSSPAMKGYSIHYDVDPV